MSDLAAAFRRLRLLFRAHPWHGVALGERSPEVVVAYVEIVPTDTVKYEIDKPTGVLRLDRPQRFSNVCPALYGFLPRTYCGAGIAALAAERTGRVVERGDGDPLDVCILTEKTITRGDLLLSAIPVGGFRLLDKGEADDKIIAVLEGDAAYGGARDLGDVPSAVIDRLRHYFLTYKTMPAPDGTFPPPTCEVASVYGRDEARRVIQVAEADYRHSFAEAAEAFALAGAP